MALLIPGTRIHRLARNGSALYVIQQRDPPSYFIRRRWPHNGGKSLWNIISKRIFLHGKRRNNPESQPMDLGLPHPLRNVLSSAQPVRLATEPQHGGPDPSARIGLHHQTAMQDAGELGGRADRNGAAIPVKPQSIPLIRLAGKMSHPEQSAQRELCPPCTMTAGWRLARDRRTDPSALAKDLRAAPTPLHEAEGQRRL